MALWQVLDHDTSTLTAEYTFRPRATARSMATRTGDGALLVISPPCGFDRAQLKELENHGEVRWLVAPNGLHWLGIKPLLEVFPEAGVYAPPGAASRIEKKLGDTPIRTLAELGSELTDGVEVVEVPGFRSGETWLKVRTEQGPIWYVSDSCFNMPVLPPDLVPRLLFKWTKSAPGFRINGLGKLVFLKDKAAYKAWFLEQLGEPPNIVVPAHGDIVAQSDLASTLKGMIEARL